jgi:hypothetical protein
MGWFVPLAAPLATLLAAFASSLILGRRPATSPNPVREPGS